MKSFETLKFHSQASEEIYVNEYYEKGVIKDKIITELELKLAPTIMKSQR